MFRKRSFTNKRTKFLILFLIWLMLMSVGYAYLSSTLTINGNVVVDAYVPKGRKVTNADIGKYVDLGKDVIGTEATTDDWRVLWVDETNNQTYLILADFLPTSKMPSATGITNNGSYSVYSNTNRDTLLNYMTTSSNWSSLIDSSIQGATVTGGPTQEVVEASYQAKYGGSWTNATAQADTLLVSHNATWNSCSGYWLASPYPGIASAVWYVGYNGKIGYRDYIIHSCSVRPVVCVPSSTLLDVVEESAPEDPPEATGVAVTNADIGKYVDLGKDVIGTEATTDDWRVLWVDETNSQTYLILADFLPASKMPTATGITNNGSYNVYANDNRDQLLNYMTTSSNWSSLIDSSIQGATVTGGPTKEVVEASYQAKYGGSWTNATAQADTLLVSHNATWNSCSGYWLASPYTGIASAVWYVGYNGKIGYWDYIIPNYSVRPVVCVPSSTLLDVVEESAPEDPPEATGVAVTNADIGKYVDLGKDVIGTEATTDDWRVLWVDETNSQTYLILADFLPASKMPTATGITNNGSYNVYANNNRDQLLNYMTTSSNWSSLIDSSIQGATVTGGPTIEVVEASYQAKYGGSWTNATAQADTLLVSHNAEWNSCLAYWLASPCGGNTVSVWDVDYTGWIMGYRYDSFNNGVRPVVCVPSSTLLNVVE